MKSISKIAVLFIAFNAWTMIAPQKATAQVSINFQVFYDDLSPYGNWVLNSHYGYVWIPDVSIGFTPYGTNGHWVFTNVGWTWVSNYSWGWAPFHYGRWYYDYIYGWIWVPDYEWGPAWVVWRRCEGYYGWTPIGPGISINIAYGGSYNIPYNQWILVRDNDLGRTNIDNYYVRTSDNTRILKNSTVITNIRTDNSNKIKYSTGPDRSEIEKRTGNSIKTVAIKERNKPGQNMGNGELYVYKPRVEKHTGSGQKPIPYKVLSMKDVKPNTKINTSQRYEQSAPQPKEQNRKQQAQQLSPRYEQPAKQTQKQNREQHTQQLSPRYEEPLQQPQKQNREQQQPHKQYQVQYPQQQPQRYEQSVQQPQNQNHNKKQSQSYNQPVPQQLSHQPQQQQQHSKKQH